MRKVRMLSLIISKDGFTFSSAEGKYFTNMKTYTELINNPNLRKKFLEDAGLDEIIIEVKSGNDERGFRDFLGRSFGTYSQLTNKFKGGYEIV